jgi:MFS family permease
MVYLVAFLTGLANAVEMPTRQAFATELVGPELLPNAVGLNSATFNGGRVFGPAVAGLLIVLVGTGWCFVLNAASFLAVLVGLLLMRVHELVPVRRPPRGKGMIRDGLTYAWASPVLRSTLVVVFIVGLLTLNFTVVLPAIAKDVFGGDAGLVGLFSAVQGAGALVASFLAARRAEPTTRLFVGSSLALGVTMLAVGAAPTVELCLVAVFFSGVAFLTMMLTANARLQLNSSMERRGRVMALYVLMFGGTTPIGSPTIGWISDRFGPRWGAIVGGVAALAAAATVPVTTRAAERRRAGAAVEVSGVVPAQL